MARPTFANNTRRCCCFLGLIVGLLCTTVQGFQLPFSIESSTHPTITKHRNGLRSKYAVTPTYTALTRNGPILETLMFAKSNNEDDENDEKEDEDAPKLDKVVKESALLLRRLSWGAWWAQLILTTVSSVTLLFARNVIRQSNGGSIAQANSLPNFLLAGTGIIISVVSIFWTWASRRLSRRLLRKTTSRIQAANMLRKAINVGVTLNLAGILCTIIGAEQIVGVLAVKVLTAARTISFTESSSLLQPLDILVVQANTNTLFSHFCSIVALLYMSRSIAKLDPPSVEGDERKR